VQRQGASPVRHWAKSKYRASRAARQVVNRTAAVNDKSFERLLCLDLGNL